MKSSRTRFGASVASTRRSNGLLLRPGTWPMTFVVSRMPPGQRQEAWLGIALLRCPGWMSLARQGPLWEA